MSGVIDENGIQWEHCNCCSKFARLDNLGYEPPTTEFKHGRDICLACTNKHPNIESIEPAKSWLPQFDT